MAREIERDRSSDSVEITRRLFLFIISVLSSCKFLCIRISRFSLCILLKLQENSVQLRTLLFRRLYIVLAQALVDVNVETLLPLMESWDSI